MARKSKELEELKKMFLEEDRIHEEELVKMEGQESFITYFQEQASYLSDDRFIEHTLHSIDSVLLVVIFGIMAYCNTFLEVYNFMIRREEWLKKHIKFDCVLPSISTIRRVIGIINPRELEELCTNVLNTFLVKNEEYYKNEDMVIKDIKSMDGKTANSSDRKSSKNGEIKKMNAMSVLSVKNDYCEATEFIDIDKTNEIPTGPELLKRIEVKDCIIVFDAMSTQEKTIKEIVSKEGYYIALVKGNQGILEENIKLFFNDIENYEKKEKIHYKQVIEKAHSTVEKREYTFINDIDWLYNKQKWEDLKSIGMVTRTYIDKKGKEIKDTRYFISNINASKIDLLSDAIRKEWHIENGLHFYLDMTFEKDKNKCFLEHSQKNLNIIRKFCLAILKKYKQITKESLNIIRFNIAQDYEYEIDSILKKIFY